MVLPLDVTLLVLLAALMHASWNAIAKAGTNKLLDITAMAVAGGAVCALMLPFLPVPEPEAWPWLAASLLLHFIYFMALVGAYAAADLSHAYPLMRGIAPLLVALFGALLLDDGLTASMWAGIALISTGILLPFWLNPGDKAGLLRGSSFALANAVVIASYTLVDGYGTRLSAHPLSYCLWLFLLDPLPILDRARAPRQRRVAALSRALGAVHGRRHPDRGRLRHRAVGDDARADCGGCRAARNRGHIRRADRRRPIARGPGRAAHNRRRAGRRRHCCTQAVAAAPCLRAICRSSIGRLRIAASTPMPIVSSHISRYEPVASNR